MNGCVAACTWDSVDGKNIDDAVTWLDEEQSVNIEDIIQAENCLLLQGSPASQNECRLTLSCPKSVHIKGIVSLSESRLLEISGDHGEYLQTVRGAVVDQVDDMVVYRGEISFNRPVTECSVKFAALKDKSKMWLYGVAVQAHGLTLQKNYGYQIEPILLREDKETQTSDGPNSGWADLRLDQLAEKLTDSMECQLQQLEKRLCTKLDQIQQELEERLERLLQQINHITIALSEDNSSQEATL